MKKNILGLTTITLITTATILSGCKKKSTDITPPIITALGSNPFYLQKSLIWTEPGVIASDANDGYKGITTTGTVNSGTPGMYILTYSATDNAGNTASFNRTVYVVDLNGSYSLAQNISPYPHADTTTVDTTTYTTTTMSLSTDGIGRLAITNFGNYANATVFCTLTSPNALTLPSQTVTCGTAPNIYARTFAGTGSITATLHYTNQIIINYTELTLNISPLVSSQVSIFR